MALLRTTPNVRVVSCIEGSPAYTAFLPSELLPDELGGVHRTGDGILLAPTVRSLRQGLLNA